jgi:hypothetical protein
MSAISDYLEDKLLDLLFNDTDFDPASTDIYVALHTASPADDGSGAEVSAGGYARVQVSAWDASSGGATANTAAIAFATATASWGTITHAALWDAITAGNLLWHGALDSSVVVASGQSVRFDAGELDVTIT